MSYFQRENRELVNVDSCELLASRFSLLGDFSASCALDFLAEVTEQMLPPAEPAEKYFRLLATVIEHMHSGKSGAVWQAVTYFSLWTVRLAGLLPELHTCLECGSWLDDPEQPKRAFFSRFRDGLYCQDCRRSLDLRSSWDMSAESRVLAEEMLRTPISQIAERPWSQATAADLRRFLGQQIESHIERRLITFPLLEAAA
jgi:DNA repair protein RecO (recombination protein O)